MDATTSATSLETFVQTLTDRFSRLTRSLGAWVQAEPRSLQQLEEHLLGQLHELGNALLTGLLTLAAAAPPTTVTCPCGATATFRRLRPASITTLLGRLTYTRATYSCATCHQGHAPLDQQLQVAAGSFSLGLQELLALLGATQASFADAATVLQRLCLVRVCPNSVRSATQELGTTLAQHSHQAAQLAQEQGQRAVPQSATPPQLYISMDGVLVHCQKGNWREVKTGCVYTTRSTGSRRSPHKRVLRMEQPSYSASLAEAASFGWLLAVEAQRRGVDVAQEVIVLGDGAHWIWKLAEEHFPQATQIVDWYHASQYIWQAGSSVYGEGTAQRAEWAKQQLDALWEGRLEEVLAALQPGAGDEGACDAALSYYSTHRERMDYPSYRARGLQLGSGTIESTCKHLIGARLKQAGMIWSEAGAEAVSVVRAWLKSGRWGEAMGLRHLPRRQYRRREQEQARGEALEAQTQEVGTSPEGVARVDEGSREVIARVQAELAQEAAVHPWRRAWSLRQQRRQAEARLADTTVASAA
jgi:Uncharacterised protein family (UPF0236)